jgi:hypothetical protein
MLYKALLSGNKDTSILDAKWKTAVTPWHASMTNFVSVMLPIIDVTVLWPSYSVNRLDKN